VDCVCTEEQKGKLVDDLKLLSHHVSVLSRDPSKEEGWGLLPSTIVAP
jgi:hypothetical protein